MRALRFILLLLTAAGAGFGGSEIVYRYFFVQHETERAEAEIVAPAEIDRELTLLRDQFADDDVFASAMRSSHLTEASLRHELEENLHERLRIEKQIASTIIVTEAEAGGVYDTRGKRFELPKRYRARHIFLAAPDGSAPDVMAAKQSAIQGLAVRILAGEKFEQLAAEASEDEATKLHGGDLGYFSAARMPPEFIAELEKLQVGELSPPIRSHLGFHIVQLMELKPSGELSYEQARPEIQLSLGNLKRAAAVAQLRAQLGVR